MTNADDDQGLWDRWIFVVSSQDFDADDEETNPFKDLAPEDDFDVSEYLTIMNKEHHCSRTYTLNEDAQKQVLKIRSEVKEMVEHANRRFVPCQCLT